MFKGFRKLSLVDYPGKLCAIAFTGGCNFRCPWCYVRDLVLNPEMLPSTKDSDIIKFLKRRKDWLDALVVSGGEPTIHENLPTFLGKVKRIGYSVGLETNGSNPEMLRRLIKEGLVDYIEMDVKAPLSKYDKYCEVSGVKVNIKRIRESVSIIKRSQDYAFRTTVVPTLLRSKDVVSISKELRGAKRYYIQQFKPMDTVMDARFKEVKPYPINVLNGIVRRCRRYVKNTELRGV